MNTESLSVDWVNNKIYWTDISERRIGVMDLLNRNNYKYDLLSTEENSSPRGIAVDPTTRYMCNDICVCAFGTTTTASYYYGVVEYRGIVLLLYCNVYILFVPYYSM